MMDLMDLILLFGLAACVIGFVLMAWDAHDD